MPLWRAGDEWHTRVYVRYSVAARVNVDQVCAGHTFSQSQRLVYKERAAERPTLEAQGTYYYLEGSWQQAVALRVSVGASSRIRLMH